MKSNQLAVGLVTFNRAACVRKTLESFFDVRSPLRGVHFYVFDNCSTDDTERVVNDFAEKCPSVRYIKNSFNIGPNGNIVRAIEYISRSGVEYGWVIGDDDLYDFSHWAQVEVAMHRHEKVICCARYHLPDEYLNDVARQLLQLNFLGGLIFSTSLIYGDVVRCMYDSIYTMFPHLIPVVHYINEGGLIYVVRDAVVKNGWVEEVDVAKKQDVSYIRGVGNAGNYNPKIVSMRWSTGWAELCNCINDAALREKAFNVGVIADCLSFENYIAWMRYYFRDRRFKSNVAETLSVVGPGAHQSALLELIEDLPANNRRMVTCPSSFVACPRNKWWKVTRDIGGRLTFAQLWLLFLRRIYLYVFKRHAIV